jgi:predicted GNAT family acetyltransferase
MVSTASTTAENSLSAMVVGVATLLEYKKKGYATQCMVKLCQQLLQEGKELCLFYDNPAAGAIYKRIGFQDIGFWMMYSFNKMEG